MSLSQYMVSLKYLTHFMTQKKVCKHSQKLQCFQDLLWTTQKFLSCVYEPEIFTEKRATQDYQNVGFLPFSVQEKAESVTSYNETKSVTQTQRN